MICPSQDRLRDFLSGRLTPAEANRLSAHLDGCEDCEAMLGRLSNDPDLGSWLANCAPLELGTPPDPRLAHPIDGPECPFPVYDRSFVIGVLPFLAPPTVDGDLGTFGRFRVLSVLG